MPIQWGTAEVQERVYAATIASMDKVNIHEIARLYGRDMTYNALEGQLRKIKKEAAKLKVEAAGREAAAPSPAKPRKSPTKQAVKTGRVTKPKAKTSNIKIKSEQLVDEDDELPDYLKDGSEGNGTSNTGSLEDLEDEVV